MTNMNLPRQNTSKIKIGKLCIIPELNDGGKPLTMFPPERLVQPSANSETQFKVES